MDKCAEGEATSKDEATSNEPTKVSSQRLSYNLPASRGAEIRNEQCLPVLHKVRWAARGGEEQRGQHAITRTAAVSG
eukprot:1299972-Rhodomonas_salina.2